ncbi:helix-turn-helix transcriptional regulator [Adlercreutzia sp. R21]|uniref:response regulator transcription factor n=1 Tax=Adlercreutzia wanghongyangiae TaxID=3111451 RepID=UPI002DB6FC81|nr:helix-turn-helix transcriptional regulator [Adlercreutzia sp. R21]MEC4184791.1 helix-turn-helix transcriptional regulator [Adlercreutzia sp. R21]
MDQKNSLTLDRRTLGYAVNLLLLFQTSQGFTAVAQTQLGDTGFRTLYQWPLTIALVGTLLLLGMQGLLAPRAPSARSAVAATTFILLGVSCVTVETFANLAPDLLVRLAAVAFGIGLALSFTLWQNILFAEGIERARPKIILGTAVASITDIILIQMGTTLVPLLAMTVLTAANGWGLAACLPDEADSGRSNVPTAPKLSASGLFLSIWRYVLCVGVIGFASRTSQTLAVEVAGASMNIYLAVAMLASSVAMVILWLRKKPFSLQNAFTVLSALVTAGFVSLLFIPHSVIPFIAAFAFFAFSIVSMLMVIATIEIAASREANPTFVFGTFAGIAYLLTDAGPLLTNALENQLGLSPIVVVSVSVIYLVAFAGVALNMAKGTSSKREAAETAEDVPVDLSSSFIRPVVVQQDLIPLCCQQLRKRYQLTVRETEILELLARGRDLARMADVLFVSQNTIRSHTRNLYKKLNVHSKQEALDLLEQTKEAIVTEIAR